MDPYNKPLAVMNGGQTGYLQVTRHGQRGLSGSQGYS